MRRIVTALEQLAADARFGARILWRAPALSITAMVLVALVIGGNTTIFSIVHGILTKPAAGITGTGLVSVGWVVNGDVHPGTSFPNYAALTESRLLRPLLAEEFERFILTNADGSYALQGAMITPNYFDTLGIRLVGGRTFSERESRLDAAGLVAVVSERLSQEHFGGSREAIGRTTILNGYVATIVGMAASPFRGVMLGKTADVWVPIGAYLQVEGRQRLLTDWKSPLVLVIGRLAAGASMGEAQAELTTIAQRMQREDAANLKTPIRLYPYSGTGAGDSLVAQRGPWFLGMFSIITVLTLLIVCANVANPMLARALVRAREMAVRQSFGASRARIVRIFVFEGLAISIVAWAAASLFAMWTTSVIPQMIPPLDGSATRIAFDFAPDWRVLGYAMALALGGTALFCVAPALQTCRQDLQPLLQAGDHGLVQGRSSLSSALVVLQLAFSVLLLTTAGFAYLGR